MPHFMAFMSEHFPELSNIDRLREVSDLSSPAQWYVSVQTVCVCVRAHMCVRTHACLYQSYNSTCKMQCTYIHKVGVYTAVNVNLLR